MSTLLSATVLLAFGTWTWTIVQRTSLMRIDENIRELASRPLTMHQFSQYWEFVSQGMEFVLGDIQDNPFIMLVKDRDGNVTYTSSNWPSEIDPATIPTPIEAGFTDEPEKWEPPWLKQQGDHPGGPRFISATPFSPGNQESTSPETTDDFISLWLALSDDQESTLVSPLAPDNQGVPFGGIWPPDRQVRGAPDRIQPNDQRPGPRDARPPDGQGPGMGDGPPPDEQGRDPRDRPPPDGRGPGMGDGPPPDEQGRVPGLSRGLGSPISGGPMPQGFPFGPRDLTSGVGGPPPPMSIKAVSFFTAKAGPNKWRIGVMSNPEATLVFGLNLAPFAVEMNRFQKLVMMAVPAALLLIGLGSWWLAQRALRPIQALTQTAEGITARGLDQRIPVSQEDIEFDRLIRVFNGMLDRLEKSFQQAVRFSADAAHELKTPLTILLGELAQAVQGAGQDTEQQQTLNSLLEEVQRLKTITRKLLLLSLADSGQLKPQTEPVDFSEVIQGMGEDIEILAPHLRVQEAIENDLWIEADPDLLRQVVQNLVSNAVKYNSPDGVVTIDLRKEAGNTCLTVGNSGPGIPAGDEERIFERFYRADKAHNRRVDGTGLGLSLAREIVRAHHGELALEQTRPGWTAFTVRIPAIARPTARPEPH